VTPRSIRNARKRGNYFRLGRDAYAERETSSSQLDEETRAHCFQPKIATEETGYNANFRSDIAD